MIGWGAVLVVALLAIAVPGSAGADEAALLELSGVTFVGSHSGEQDVVLESERAWLALGQGVARLEGVHARLKEGDGNGVFELRCDRARLDLGSIDFQAEGNVVARTGDGRRLYTSSVQYRSEPGIVSTEAPVRIEEEATTLRGRGFRYYVRESRLVLTGGVTVEGRL